MSFFSIFPSIYLSLPFPTSFFSIDVILPLLEEREKNIIEAVAQITQVQVRIDKLVSQLAGVQKKMDLLINKDPNEPEDASLVGNEEDIFLTDEDEVDDLENENDLDNEDDLDPNLHDTLGKSKKRQTSASVPSKSVKMRKTQNTPKKTMKMSTSIETLETKMENIVSSIEFAVIQYKTRAQKIESLCEVSLSSVYTSRSIARVFHGLNSPTFPSNVWKKSSYWGEFVSVDFDLVKHLAGHSLYEVRIL